MRATTLFLIAATAFFVAACGKDSNGSTGPVSGEGPQQIVYTLTVDTTLADTATATVGTAVPVRVQVTKAGAIVPNGTVKWKVSSGGGTVSSDSTTTDANGDASILWTLGDTAGYNVLAISSFDASAAYVALGTAGVATELTRVTADSSLVVAGASLPLSVRAMDRRGNGATGADITWSATGGEFTFTTTPAGATGGATTVFTTTAPGTYFVTATLAGHASVLFKIVAL
jgi:adhesin/invasin